MVLHEIPNARQIPGEPFRRWFYCFEQDLYVWYDDAERITAFQLCYAKDRNEHAIYWRADRGYSHLRVERSRRNATPVLVADGSFDKDAVLGRFNDLAMELPAEVVRFVTARLDEYRARPNRQAWWRQWF